MGKTVSRILLKLILLTVLFLSANLLIERQSLLSQSDLVEIQLFLLAYWFFVSRTSVGIRISIWMIVWSVILYVYYSASYLNALDLAKNEVWTEYEWAIFMLNRTPGVLILLPPLTVLIAFTSMALYALSGNTRANTPIGLKDLFVVMTTAALVLACIVYIQPYPKWSLDCLLSLKLYYSSGLLVFGYMMAAIQYCCVILFLSGVFSSGRVRFSNVGLAAISLAICAKFVLRFNLIGTKPAAMFLLDIVIGISVQLLFVFCTLYLIRWIEKEIAIEPKLD